MDKRQKQLDKKIEELDKKIGILHKIVKLDDIDKLKIEKIHRLWEKSITEISKQLQIKFMIMEEKVLRSKKGILRKIFKQGRKIINNIMSNEKLKTTEQVK